MIDEEFQTIWQKFMKAAKGKDIINLEISIETLENKKMFGMLSEGQKEELLSAKELLENLKMIDNMKSIRNEYKK